MGRGDICFEKLNAYVDGELPAAEAARVARLVAADGELAHTVALLQELRAGVADMVPDVVLLPGNESAAPVTGWRPRMLVLAAAVAVAAVVGSGLWWVQPSSERPAPDRLVFAQMVERHDAWTEPEAALVLPSGVASARITALMQSSGLRLVHGERLAFADGTLVGHTGYLGANGCRLSLFEAPLGATFQIAAGVLELAEESALLTASWQTDTTQFVMMARKMDQVRFATIASSIRSATEAAISDEHDLIAALEGARQRCLA